VAGVEKAAYESYFYQLVAGALTHH